MNQTQELLEKPNYHRMVENCLIDIVKEFRSGKSKVTIQEHKTLCLQLQEFMKSNIDIYIIRIGLLTPAQIKSMVMRMDYSLFRQCFKNEEHKLIAYALQFKLEFDNMENAVKNALKD
jgi:hypothetical protein